DDAGEGVDAVSDEGILHRADDRDAAGDGGLEVDGRVHLAGELEELHATLGEERFVAGDDGLFRTQGGGDDVEGVGGAADELDDDVNGGVFDELAPVRGENAGIHRAGGGACLGEVAHENACDVQAHTAACAAGDEFAVAFEGV